MWLSLALAILAYIVVLYLPGFLCARAFSIDRFAAVVIAPALSIPIFVALGVALVKAGFTCSGLELFGIATAFSLVTLLISKAVARGRHAGTAPGLIPVGDTKNACKTAALYVGVALVITVVVFLLPIDGPQSFSRNDDTTVHLSLVRGFIDTGTYSTLHTSSYLAQSPDSGYYPAARHVATAIVASLFDGGVTLATNASIVALNVFVFPLGICLLLMKLFHNDKRFVLAGSLFAVAFAGFPWTFIVFGQLFPNMLAFMLIPLTLIPLIEAIEAGRVQDKIKLGILVGAGVIAIALSQPNAAFTFGIWAVLYGINRMVYPPTSERAALAPKRIAGAIALLVVACAVWAALYFAPFMQNVVQYTWKETLSPLVGLASGLSFMFTSRSGIQPFLSIVVLAGILYTCKHRRHLWLSVAFAFALLAYLISVSSDGTLKHVIAGFWYTDYHRLGPMAAFFAIPLAALGFTSILKVLKAWCGKLLKAQTSRTHEHIALSMLLALFMVMSFFPGKTVVLDKIDVRAGLMKIRSEVSTRYSWKRVLTSEENNFVKKVMDTIPPGALVINVPSDGSCWSYGVEGINTYFRRSADNGMSGARDSKILRMQLKDVRTSSEAQEVVQRLNARYVLMLDESSSDKRTTTSQRYEAKNWTGIESINEQTPGFTLLLSEGDMRLYEIDQS